MIKLVTKAITMMMMVILPLLLLLLLLLGRFLRVDLIKWVSSDRLPVRTSVRPQNVSSISVKFGM